MPRNTNRKPSWLSRIVRRIIVWIYHAKGWRIDSDLPDIPKYVIAGAPHSSNWDFVFFAGATHEQGVRPSFMGKHTLFKGIMRNFMFDMGGVPIDRSKTGGMVGQIAAEFERQEKLALVIAPEGTRGAIGEWKSGFWHIARAAGVPIVTAWVNPKEHVLGFAEPFMPTDNFAADLAHIAAYLRSKRPDYERYKVLEAQAQRLMVEGNGDA